MPNIYEIETDLMALVDSAETVTPEQEDEYRLALELALRMSIKKRPIYSALRLARSRV